MARTTARESFKIVPPGKKKCIWMEAGVVSYKLCDNNYDCSTCRYDHAMQDKVNRRRQAQTPGAIEPAADSLAGDWVEKMMALPASQRKCRYMLTGEIGRKLCPNAYECGSCSFDQMMQQRMDTETLPAHVERQVAGFEVADGFYFHEGHVWARPEYGGRVRVGIDDFAQKVLGPPGSVALPEVGAEVRQGMAAVGMTRGEDPVRVLSPVDGVVSRINGMLLIRPGLINESPYEKGWLFTVEPTGLKKNLKGLFFGEEAAAFMDTETRRLLAAVGGGMPVAADGGVSVADIRGELGRDRWVRLINDIFRS